MSPSEVNRQAGPQGREELEVLAVTGSQVLLSRALGEFSGLQNASEWVELGGDVTGMGQLWSLRGLERERQAFTKQDCCSFCTGQLAGRLQVLS